jgi:hypothetical protein
MCDLVRSADVYQKSRVAQRRGNNGGGMMDSSLESPIGTMNILDSSGHRQVHWDMSNSKDIAAAQKTFDRLAKQGYAAFGSMKGADAKQAVTTFDPAIEELVMVPRIVGG